MKKKKEIILVGVVLRKVIVLAQLWWCRWESGTEWGSGHIEGLSLDYGPTWTGWSWWNISAILVNWEAGAEGQTVRLYQKYLTLSLLPPFLSFLMEKKKSFEVESIIKCVIHENELDLFIRLPRIPPEWYWRTTEEYL